MLNVCARTNAHKVCMNKGAYTWSSATHREDAIKHRERRQRSDEHVRHFSGRPIKSTATCGVPAAGTVIGKIENSFQRQISDSENPEKLII